MPPITVFVGLLLGGGLMVAALRGGSYAPIPRAQASIAIWWVIGLTFAFGLLPSGRMSTAQRVAVLALVALVAWTAIGITWTSSAERTVDESARVLTYAGLAMLVAWSFRDRDRTTLVAVVAVAASAICVLALVARLAPEVAESALAKSGYAASRLDFPFNYWNALGCWSGMTTALALAFSAHAPAWWQRGLALAVASIAPVVVYLTYSRAAALNVALACVLVILFSSRRWLIAFNVLVAGAAATAVIFVIRGVPAIARGTGTQGRGAVILAVVLAAGLLFASAGVAPHRRLAALRLPPRLWRPMALGLLAAAVVAAVFAGPQLGREAWRSFQRPDTPIATDPAQRLTSLGGNRHDLWPAAIDVFTDHPVQGIGAGTFEFAWNVDARRSGHVIDAHSIYLEALAELGLPGALLVVLALGALLVAAVRAPFREEGGVARGAAAGCAAAFAVFCVSAGVDWMWESTAVACAAIVLGTVAAAGPRLAVPVRRPALRIGGAIVALVAILVQIPLLVGASQIVASQDAVAHGRLVDALADANSAAASQPWAATAALQRALVLERVGTLAAAERAAKEATRLEPQNWTHWLVLGRIRAERGHLKPALAAVARARQLNPRSPLFRPGVATRLARPGG